MTLVKESELKVRDIPVTQLEANPWNPNRVPPALFEKLKKYLEREGFAEPIVTRQIEDGRFQILGGEHRWRAARELGMDTVPAVVLDIDERRAKVLSINLNELRGASVPSLLAELVHDLSRDLSLDDLASQLPYDATELADLQALLQIPDGLELELAEQAEQMERERPRVLAFALSPEQEQIVEEAVTKALSEVAGTSRGAALTHIAQRFLGGGGEG